jgi:hypothetical protein
MMNDLTEYCKVKDQMKTGDLLQWHSASVIGILIRMKTKSFVNHSSLIIRLSEYEGLERMRYTTEALEHGIILNRLSKRLETFDGKVYWYPLKDEWDAKRQKIGEVALSYIGTPYDYKSIVRQLFGHVSADARALFCSEYCFISYGFTGTAPDPGDMPSLGIFKEHIRIL